MSRALYRTYRPRSLKEIVGQEHITDLLQRALDKDSMSHAYLLTGPRGIGKTSVARILAHEINKLPYSDDQHLDIIEIDAASNRRIDDIRDLRDKVHVAPISARYKIYIIDEVHMLTTESFNALLKTLEEPPAHVVFILATTEAHKVPATILSRTQRFHFRPVDEQKVAAHLASIAQKENIKVEDAALRLIARHGGGSFRDSIGLLDQLAGHDSVVTESIVESTLGLIDGETIRQLTDAVIGAKTKAVLECVKQLRAGGASPAVLTEQLIAAISDKADEHPSLYGLIDQLLDVPRAYDPFIKLLAVLVRHCEAARPRTAALQVNTPTISAVVAPVVLPSQTSPQPDIRPTAERPESESAPAKPTAKVVTAPGSTFDWQAVLEAAKKHNAPLHSVIARARSEYADGTLSLYFLFALHRKKLEQQQYHSQLTQLIVDVCGDCPVIEIKDGKTMSQEVSAVAAIMGGGEPVNAR